MPSNAINNALERLIQGNQRFVSHQQNGKASVSPRRRQELLQGQKPFALVLSCSDSRVPPEIIFDQGLGELFVVRVAGNIATPSQIGSLEFAAKELGCRLLVVLGHSQCGAVEAALKEKGNPSSPLSLNLQSIIKAIKPAAEKVLKRKTNQNPSLMAQEVIRENILNAIHCLKRGSPMLESWIKSGELQIIGAKYLLNTGVVEFFETGGKNE